MDVLQLYYMDLNWSTWKFTAFDFLILGIGIIFQFFVNYRMFYFIFYQKTYRNQTVEWCKQIDSKRQDSIF